MESSAYLRLAGSLIMYEELGPELTMTCPALLMRNTTDDPKWTSSIYHNHVTWFPGGSYPVEKLFCEHYAECYLASAMGSFDDVPDRSQLVDKISTTIPSGWREGAMDAIATASADGMRVVVKTVNYTPRRNTLLVRLQGQSLPERAKAKLYTIAVPPDATASFDCPEIFTPVTNPCLMPGLSLSMSIHIRWQWSRFKLSKELPILQSADLRSPDSIGGGCGRPRFAEGRRRRMGSI